MTIKTRFAPSPTGFLHIGGARTALYNYLFAKRYGGEFILRIEDTDFERHVKDAVHGIIEAMEWLGLEYDGEVYYQSKRFDIYRKYAQKLLDSGKAYRCFCTKKRLDSLREEQKKNRSSKLGYDGKCRNIPKEESDRRAKNEEFVIRFKMDDKLLTINDLVHGEVKFDTSLLDDLVIMKSSGTPTYNFSVAIDDMLMGITHVIRGDDHISNTPKQLLIYKALGVEPPKYAHIPMVLGRDGARLSKRHGAKSILEYRDAGFLPNALINYLARLGWGYGDQEYFTVEELIEKFSLENVNLSAARFDPDKLLAVNAYWIRNSNNKYLLEHLKPFLKNYDLSKFSEDYLLSAIETVKTRAKTLVEMAEMMHFYLVEDVEYEEKGANKFLVPEIKPILKEVIEEIEKEPLEEEKFEKFLRGLAEEKRIKLKNIAQAIRVALTGKTVSPGLFEIIKVLGKDKVIKRLNRAIEFIKSKG